MWHPVPRLLTCSRWLRCCLTLLCRKKPDASFAGTVTAIAPALDVDTRNLVVQARLDNTDGKLRPGMFGHVTLSPGASQSGIAVPETAPLLTTFRTPRMVL